MTPSDLAFVLAVAHRRRLDLDQERSAGWLDVKRADEGILAAFDALGQFEPEIVRDLTMVGRSLAEWGVRHGA